MTKPTAVLGGVEVEGVHEHSPGAGGHDADAQGVEGQALGPAADAVAAVADGHHDFLVFDFGGNCLGRRR